MNAHQSGVVWRYIQDGVTHGPVTADQLVALLNEGQITRDTHLWTTGQGPWKPLHETQFGEHLPPPIPSLTADLPPPIPRGAPTVGIATGAGLLLLAFVLIRGCVVYEKRNADKPKAIPTDDAEFWRQYNEIKAQRARDEAPR